MTSVTDKYPPSHVTLLPTQTEETIPREKLKMLLDECIQERDTYIQETFSEKNKPRLVKEGDTLLARISFNGTPSLAFQDGSKIFFGINCEKNPIQRVVDESNDYTGIKTFTVDGVTFHVDFTKYNEPFHPFAESD